ncbi:MAG: hypothetical protein HRU20_04600 [Pseudomonadales bacterium]|nr:hypothetical protein [Pseudomonadales bacterium]
MSLSAPQLRPNKAATILYSIALLPIYIGGLVYSCLNQFMPYHAVAVGHEWHELETGTQMLILAALNGAGSLMLTMAMVMTLLLLIPYKKAERWALIALPLLGLSTMLIVLRSALLVDLNTPANPPWFVLIIIMVFIAIAAGLTAKPTNSTL